MINAGHMDRLEIGFCILPRDVRTTEEYAREAEAAGVGWLGVCDSPLNWAEPHAVIQAALRATSSIRVGTLVTNPITRHWSAQAGAFRTLEEIAPGRPFMGISTGDTAVLDAGLRPARMDELASYVEEFREVSPSTPVVVAAGGPKSAARAAEYADQLLFGQGFSRSAVQELSERADTARTSKGDEPLPKWLFVIASLVSAKSDETTAQEDIRETVFGQAVQAFSGSLAGRGVSPELGADVQAFFKSRTPAANTVKHYATTLRYDERAEVERFLFRRYALACTPEEGAERLLVAVRETGCTRVFLALISEDMDRVMGLAVSRLVPRLLS
jgi:5,10-methylenetetrahydromethanopterin reductase